MKAIVYYCMLCLAGFLMHSFSHGSCKSRNPLNAQERKQLIERLDGTRTGRKILKLFKRKYGSLTTMQLFWHASSFTQILDSPASNEESTEGGLGAVICIHLSNQLPALENIADFAHELTHVTQMTLKNFKGEVANVQEFIDARLKAPGGEASAFAIECQVKHEILGKWDSFCAPYVSQSNPNAIELSIVISDLYSGKLSASLTGESYPALLEKQFHQMKSSL